MARAFLIVMDSVGCGGAPDAAAFGDEGSNTLGHIAQACAAGRADLGRQAPRPGVTTVTVEMLREDVREDQPAPVRRPGDRLQRRPYSVLGEVLGHGRMGERGDRIGSGVPDDESRYCADGEDDQKCEDVEIECVCLQ